MSDVISLPFVYGLDVSRPHFLQVNEWKLFDLCKLARDVYVCKTCPSYLAILQYVFRCVNPMNRYEGA